MGVENVNTFLPTRAICNDDTNAIGEYTAFMKVRELMRKKLITISPDTSYEGAIRLMHGESLSAVMVVDAGGTLVGILSEKDLFRAMYPDYGEYFVEPEAFTDEDEREQRLTTLRKQLVRDFMSTHVYSVTPETNLMVAGGIMLSHHIHQLPVLEGGKLVGVLSREYLFKKLLHDKLAC